MTQADVIFVPDELTPRGPADLTSTRRAGSVRRTSTLDFSWPDGWHEPGLLVGRARDLLTPVEGDPEVLAFDELRMRLRADRTIESLESDPPRERLQELVGVRGGNGSRVRIAETFADELEQGTPLYLLLDDFPGGALVSGVARMSALKTLGWRTQQDADAHADRMRGVCTGFQPGSSALNLTQLQSGFVMMPVEDLGSASDPLAWHTPEPGRPGTMRRARRIDVWREADVVMVDSAFGDSVIREDDTGRMGVHEYLLRAQVDAATMTLAEIEADPRILPWHECPLATLNLKELVGTPMRDLRDVVLDRLAGTAGCTHLNDAARALAEVPVLAAAL